MSSLGRWCGKHSRHCPAFGQSTGYAAIRACKCRSARVVITTAVDGEEDIFRGLKGGARGYILKDVPISEVGDAALVARRRKKGGVTAVAA
jgi:DNA-binding NarL/FixJ family response regulator